MTVPGKGGRPRKWRSDSDRVRAFRARQRGEDEPATFDDALVDGDLLARAIDRTRQLQAELAEAIDSLAASESTLQTERRRHLATQRELQRTVTELDERRKADQRRVDQFRAVHDEVEAVRADNDQLRAALALARASSSRPNRAARRLAAKDDRRKPR